MRSPLKRTNSPADKASDDVLRRQAGTGEFAHNPVEGIDNTQGVLGILGPVLHLVGQDINISRKDQVHRGSVLHVE
jgi:hypothetical protein